MSNGVITPEELAMKLVQSKKVMNKVDSGNYKKGNINPDLLISEDIDTSSINADILEENPTPVQNIRPMEQPTESRIRQSKLPENIKKAMIEKPIPIPQISLNESINMDFISGAKRLMEQEGLLEKPTTQQKSQTRQTNTTINNSELINMLTPIIENIIRKTLDDIVDKKLNQILSAQQTTTINENLVLKVGDNIFSGLITSVKKSK